MDQLNYNNPIKKMSTVVDLPEFMSGVFPYMIRTDEYVVNIRPVDYEDAVMYFTDKEGTLFDIPSNTKIVSFEYENKDQVNQAVKESNVEITPGIKYLPLKLENSYTIYQNDYIILEGGQSFNGRLYELGDLFDYPPTEEERQEFNAGRYSSIVRASITKDSEYVKVSSTKGLDIHKSVEGQGIPDATFIVSVDYDDLEIRLSQPATESLSNITLNISDISYEFEY